MTRSGWPPTRWWSPVDYATMCSAAVARDAALFLVDERGQFVANREAGEFDDYPDPHATIGEAILAGTPRPPTGRVARDAPRRRAGRRRLRRRDPARAPRRPGCGTCCRADGARRRADRQARRRARLRWSLLVVGPGRSRRAGRLDHGPGAAADDRHAAGRRASTAPVTVARDIATASPRSPPTTPHDLFLAQGYVHAQERMWQMEVWRHISAGPARRSCSGQGRWTPTGSSGCSAGGRPPSATSPRLARDARGRSTRTPPASTPGSTTTAAASGLRVRRHRRRARTVDGARYLPGRRSRRGTSAATWTAEVFRLPRRRAAGRPGADRRAVPVPASRAGDRAARPAAAASHGRRRGRRRRPRGERRRHRHRAQARPGAACATLPATSGCPRSRRPRRRRGGSPRDHGIGSNDWVVAPSLSTSGGALLANDPHLGISMPSVWYINGLHCREVSESCPYDVVGVSFPRRAGRRPRPQRPDRVGRDERRTRTSRTSSSRRSIPADPTQLPRPNGTSHAVRRPATETIKVAGAADVTT